MKTMYAVWDFGRAPASYDFLTFLCIADITRRNYGCDHVHVVFVQADNETGWRKDKKPNTLINKAWRRDHLCVPMCRLIGATHSVCIDRDQARRIIGDDASMGPVYAGGILARLARHFPLPELQVDLEAERLIEQWLPSPHYITVTLRNTYADERNSQMAEWNKFIGWARHWDWQVVVIPDTEDAGTDDAIGGVAAVNPLIRHALYAGAITNLGVNTGPMQLCTLGALPFVMFKMQTTYHGTTPEAYKRLGMAIGDQIPWARRPDQVCVWKDDTFDNIRDAFLAAVQQRQAA